MVTQRFMSAMRAAATSYRPVTITIIPRCEDGEAWFETQDGIDVSRLEGSGFRSILSVMMRSVVLRANPQFLQTLVLDEIFAKLSVENSATLSSYLPVLAQVCRLSLSNRNQRCSLTTVTPPTSSS